MDEVKNKRKLVSVRTINDLLPIEGADLIEVAVVDGWKLVVKRGEFKINDPCIYMEIDSFLPDGNPAWQFLVDKSSKIMDGKKGHKLRTIKLRGQISQGLALPISACPPVGQWIMENFGSLEIDPSQMDFSEMLGVEKFEAPLPASLVGQALGLFPSFIQKTDQERCQNLKHAIFGYETTKTPFDYSKLTQEVLNAGVSSGRMVQDGGEYFLQHKATASPDDIYEITLKLDGSSMTAYSRVVSEHRAGDHLAADADLQIGVCSRNLELKINEENAGNSFVRLLQDTGLDKALEAYTRETGRSLAVQGEMMGPGIQGNREGFIAPKYFVFDIYDIDQGFYMPPMIRMDVFKRLVELGAKIEHTPVIDHYVKLGELGLHAIDDLLAFAEGKSITHDVREGLVFKRMDGQFSFKAISNRFLAKEKD